MADPVLQDKQFSLDGYVFGLGRPVFLDAEGGFDPGNADEVVQDAVNPQTGARIFGRDMAGNPSWVFAMHTATETEDDALAELAALGGAWRNPAYRSTGSIASLRYHLAGRTRRVFGRPRRFSAPTDNRIMQGYLAPMATFDLSDDKHYDDVESMIELRIVPPTPGGFEVPFEAPLTIDLPQDTPIPGAMIVGGDALTAPVVDFIGPVLNPIVTIGNLVIALEGALPVGGAVTVDARPWQNEVRRSGDTSGVVLSRKTRLAKALVGPGAYQAVFRGTDYTGTARCRVRWRNAHTTL